MGMSEEPIKPDPEKKPKRPRDANQLAKLVSDIATGEAEDQQGNDGATDRGSAGGKARAEKLTPEERSAIAKRAAEKRWGYDTGESGSSSGQ